MQTFYRWTFLTAHPQFRTGTILVRVAVITLFTFVDFLMDPVHYNNQTPVRQKKSTQTKQDKKHIKNMESALF